jgi:hypothetical protein
MPNTLHERVLEFLLDYRKSNPEFKFWLRQRDRGSRLSEGVWFQGTESYAFVGLYNRGGGTNMTRSFGLIFWEAEDGSLAANIEVVWNEEKDRKIIEFYKQAMDLLGGFQEETSTKYRKYLAPNNAEATVVTFLNNEKSKIDSLVAESGLSETLFLNEETFEKQLNKVLAKKTEAPMKMLDEKFVAEIKRLFENFKLTKEYQNRQLQAAFIPFGKDLIRELLAKAEITNLDLTGLIQILKAGSGDHIAQRYLPQMFSDKNTSNKLLEEFENLEHKGFTGAGKNGITKLNKKQLSGVADFLSNAFKANSVVDAVTLCDEYDNLNIPEVKKGVYSPWLFYINPTLFPIINNKHLQFLDWVEVSHKYSDSIKLFNELKDILHTDLGLVDIFVYSMDFTDPITQKPLAMSLNTILYGPPGTGKTFNTITRAIAIANPWYDFKDKLRHEVKQEYQRLCFEKQIEFVTFHQSLGYEDFIEGIKPLKPNPEDTFVKYDIEDGIFKVICKNARYIPDKQTNRFHVSKEEFTKASFFKVSLGNTLNPEDGEIYNYCIKNDCIAMGWGGNVDYSNLNEAETKSKAKENGESQFAITALNYFIHYLKRGNYVLVSNGNHSCRAIAKVTGDYFYKKTDEIEYSQFRPVEWLVKDVNIPVSEIYGRVFSQASIYKLDKPSVKLDFFVKNAAEIAKEESIKPKNYVLIIDEINRGNVSQIFGELITLIEDDKRDGCPEELTVTLPYSKQPFSVPQNIHIIGTMNTADRSVEALDTALRRRFSFVEMLPQENHEDIVDIEDISLKSVLQNINIRLEKLLSRDHMVGHSFFMSIQTVEALYNTFYNKIIPQLQEYFFGDYGKIGLVLGKAFIDTITTQPKFADFEYEDKDILLEKKVYRINNFKNDDNEIEEEEFLEAVQAIIR